MEWGYMVKRFLVVVSSAVAFASDQRPVRISASASRVPPIARQPTEPIERARETIRLWIFLAVFIQLPVAAFCARRPVLFAIVLAGTMLQGDCTRREAAMTST